MPMRLCNILLKVSSSQFLVQEGSRIVYHATFSIVARCSKTLSLGVCVSTARPAVGSRVPYAEAGVGAIATQANTNIVYGRDGLKLLKKGFSPESVLETLLKQDPDRESRQVILIDRDGRPAAFTGRKTIGWKGHSVGMDYVVAGNMLAGGRVIEAMAHAFEGSAGEALSERLMKALEAGQSAGGDRRGKVSAALLVASGDQKEGQPLLDLRIDDHSDPVEELRRILNTHQTRAGLKRSNRESASF